MPARAIQDVDVSRHPNEESVHDGNPLMAIVFTQIEIAAKADDVWSLLTDYEAYPRWNPLIRAVATTEADGLQIVLHPPGQLKFTFKAATVESVSNKQLSWQGHFGWRGFLDWSHQMEIEPASTFCTLRQTSRFTGYLIKPIPNFMMRPVRNGFARMNEAVRDMAEARQRRC